MLFQTALKPKPLSHLCMVQDLPTMIIRAKSHAAAFNAKVYIDPILKVVEGGRTGTIADDDVFDLW
jgi:hypothetical protein